MLLSYQEKDTIMDLKIGSLNGISYEVYTWGVLLYTLDNTDHLVTKKYVGNGTDPMFLEDLVADFKLEFHLDSEPQL